MDIRDLWVVYAWSRSVPREELSAWLDEHGEFRRCDPTPRGRVVTVETDELPAAWRRLFARPPVESVSLKEGGTAVIVLRGSRSEVQDAIVSLDHGCDVEQVVTADASSSSSPSSSAQGEGPLTDAEREAVVEAFRQGYFGVPRAIRLADLADELDRSDGALSQLLRRALRRLVASYVAELPEEPPLPLQDHERELESNASD